MKGLIDFSPQFMPKSVKGNIPLVPSGMFEPGNHGLVENNSSYTTFVFSRDYQGTDSS